MFSRHENNLLPGNGLTLEELSRIEENAYRSRTQEADTILRLSAALREAMQVRENALAVTATLQQMAGGKVGRIKTTRTKAARLFETLLVVNRDSS